MKPSLSPVAWRRWISKSVLVLLFIIASLPLARIGLAQGEASIASLYVALWPEYDDPRVLVIISGALSLPQQEVSLPIPAGAELNAVAYMNEEGHLLKAQYSLDGHILVFQVPTTRFHIEYYVDAVRRQDDETVVHVRIPMPMMDIQQAVLEVQQPAHVKDFQATPPLGPPKEGLGGLLYASRELGALTAGEVVEQEIRYVRSSPGLSTTPRAPTTPMPSSFGGNPTPAATSSPKPRAHPWLPIVIGIGLVVLLGGASFWWVRQQGGTLSPASSSPKNKTKRRSKTSRSVQAHKRPLPKYCPNCGHPFGPNDKYCVMCGTKRE